MILFDISKLSVFLCEILISYLILGGEREMVLVFFEGALKVKIRKTEFNFRLKVNQKTSL